MKATALLLLLVAIYCSSSLVVNASPVVNEEEEDDSKGSGLLKPINEEEEDKEDKVIEDETEGSGTFETDNEEGDQEYDEDMDDESFGSGSGDIDEESDNEEGDVSIEDEDIDIDFEERGVEVFPNGTVKYESVEKLIEMHRKEEHFKHMKTPEHFEEDENKDREKRRIFDDDERLPVVDSYSYSYLPYCAIAQLDNGCTATFIGPYHALTAGSCVYNTKTNKWYGNYNVYHKRNCNTYGTRMYAKEVYSVTGYTKHHYNDYNYALIIFNKKYPTTCWLGFAYYEPWTDYGFSIYGYPSDKTAAKTYDCLYDSMYTSSCHYSHDISYGRQYQYRCDTLGTYGAPLVSESKDRKGQDYGQRYVYGVHTGYNYKYNYGVRITKDRFNLIVSWMKQSGYYPTVTRY